MNKYKNNKGISFLIVIGSYGGFHYTKEHPSYHLCLGFIAFTIFLYDVENVLAKNLLKSKKPHTCKHIRREGESCRLNNNCKYPNCD